MSGSEDVGRREQGFTLVELLVVVVLLTIVGSATISVVVSTLRTQTYNEQLREVMDESRIVYERIRAELRSARRVLDASTDSELMFWVDANTDGLQQRSELVHYRVCPLAGGVYAVRRSTRDMVAPPALPDCTDGRTLAQTLRNATPFTYVKDPSEPNSASTAVTFDFDYDVATTRGPQLFETSTTVRLRNVA